MLNYFTLNNLRELIQQLLDIACVWALVYYCLKIVKNNSRTIQIFKGVLLIVIIRSAASFLGTSHRRKSCGFHHELGCGCGHHYLPAGNS